jgi:hypothetical protein
MDLVSLLTVASLSNRLPFDDDMFDYVILKHVAKGVPETKVHFI